MKKEFDLERFIKAQNAMYGMALSELREGQKKSHWIWYILPQIKGLGFSKESQLYGVNGIEEAKAYLENQYLSDNLRRIVEQLIHWANMGKTMEELLGGLDAMKAKSCLTLFDAVSPNDIFATALEACFKGERDEKTLLIIGQQ